MNFILQLGGNTHLTELLCKLEAKAFVPLLNTPEYKNFASRFKGP